MNDDATYFTIGQIRDLRANVTLREQIKTVRTVPDDAAPIEVSAHALYLVAVRVGLFVPRENESEEEARDRFAGMLRLSDVEKALEDAEVDPT